MTIQATASSSTFIQCGRRILAAGLALVGAMAPHEELSAQAPDPNRPVRLIVPYPPGGSADPTGRAFASWLSDKLGVPVAVDNRPGAGATIGHGLVAKAAPDGYTLLLGTSANC
jgi:tripartite-type tricarboxylate transporter receptor subunit TctC